MKIKALQPSINLLVVEYLQIHCLEPKANKKKKRRKQNKSQNKTKSVCSLTI